MPDSRPLPSLRAGTYDDPPASSETSPPQTRRQRLRRAIVGTSELAQEVLAMTNERPGRRSAVGGLTRRRQRSSSEHDDLSTSTPEADGGRRRWRNKRRRLNSGPESPFKKAIKYGYYGQVEPGKLKLELVSCDGGEHVDARHPETSLGAENLLRHDKSVYCSERPQSNIILKHADDTAFCLEKLHIVGPELGFTAPVRAGVVYVAMNMSDLQKYVDPPPHARLSHHSPRRRRALEMESPRSSPELLSVAEALRDPYINAAHTDRNRDDDSSVYNPPSPRWRDYANEATDDTYCDPSNTNPGAESHNRPITILSDASAGEEDSSPQDVLEYRSQRERMMRRRYDIENWHRTREANGTGTAATNRWSYVPTQRRDLATERRELAAMRALAERGDSGWAQIQMAENEVRDEEGESDGSMPPLEAITPDPQSHPAPEDVDPDPDSTRETRNAREKDADNDTAITTAQFQLKRGKCRVAIQFDPPVSGRFVLLKLWAGKGDGNVDVQSVVAKGWMGSMRFFPAVERR